MRPTRARSSLPTCSVLELPVSPSRSSAHTAALLLPAAAMLFAGVLLIRFEVPDTISAPTVSLFTDARAGSVTSGGIEYSECFPARWQIFNAGGGILTVAIPYIVLRELHGGSTTVGLLFAIMGAAGFLAGLLTGRFGTENREKRLLAILSCDCGNVRSPRTRPQGNRSDCIGCGCRLSQRADYRSDILAFGNPPPTRQWFGRAFAVSMNLNFVGSPIGASIAGALLTRSISLTLFVAACCAVIGGLWPAVLPSSSYEPVVQVATTD